MPLHVEITRHEILRASLVQIARDGERLEENLGHDHGAAEVEHHTAILEVAQPMREAAEVSMARVPDGGTARGWMLMDDLGADRRVHRDWHAESPRVQQDGQLSMHELRILQR